MKYNKLILLLSAATILFATSCKKTLEVSPATSLDETLAFSTPDKCLASLNGVYDAAQSGFYAGGAVRGYPFGAANIEQGDMRGEDMHNNATFFQVTYESSYDPSTANNVYMWHTLYAMINRANLVREGCVDAQSKGILTATLATQYDAECRFLRAWAHHELLIQYCRPYADNVGKNLGVTYRDTGINSLDKINAALAYNRPRDSVYKCYAKMLNDLDIAEPGLPATKSTYRVTRSACIALKMRIRMHMGDWGAVIAEGNKLVNLAPPFAAPVLYGVVKLTPSCDGAFLNNNSEESVFSIKNDANDNPGTNGGLPAMYGALSIGGRGLIDISQIMWNNPGWRCDDLRRSALAIVGPTYYYSAKYKDAVSRTDAAPQIRYAEVLLMLAEAEARQGATSPVNSRAVDLLNAVRNRSIPASALPAASYTVASFPTKVELIKAILLERRIEFLGEGKRWSDIHRLALDATYGTGGIPAKVATAYSATIAKATVVASSPTVTITTTPTPTILVGQSVTGIGIPAGAYVIAVAGASITLSQNATTPGTGVDLTFVSYNCSAPVNFPLGLAAIPYANYRFIWPIPSDETLANPVIAQNPFY